MATRERWRSLRAGHRCDRDERRPVGVNKANAQPIDALVRVYHERATPSLREILEEHRSATTIVRRK